MGRILSSLVAYRRAAVDSGGTSAMPSSRSDQPIARSVPEIFLSVTSQPSTRLNGPNVSKSVRAPIIIEAANAPTEPEADEIFERRQITVVPDIKYPFEDNPAAPDLYARTFDRRFMVDPRATWKRKATRTSYTNLLTYSNDYGRDLFKLWVILGICYGVCLLIVGIPFLAYKLFTAKVR